MPNANRQPVVIVSANSLWNIENFRGNLIAALVRAGYLVTIAAPGSQDSASRSPDLGRHLPLPLRSEGMNPVADAFLFLTYLRIFQQERPAAYLSFTAKPNIYGALAAGLLGIPAVPNVSGLGTAFIRGGMLQRLLSTLYRLAFRKASRVFFQNGEDRALFVKRRLVRAERCQVLPGSGVDLSRFQPRAETIEKRQGPTFLYVGRLLGDKGVREFVEAARLVRARHPECRFQLLGFAGVANRTAITPGEVAGWVEEGTVEYLGGVDDVRPYLAAASAVVLPSYREGLPRSLLEAAAMGRPLIATDVPGNREVVIDGENGLLCEVRSASSLAQACARFLALPAADRRRMGRTSRRMVEERFSEEKVIAAYLDALAEVVGPVAHGA